MLKLCYLGPISKGWCLQQILPNCNNNLEVFVLTLPINGKAHLSYSLHNFVHISNGFWQNGHHFVKNGMPLENRTPLDSWTEGYHCNSKHVTYSSPHCILLDKPQIISWNFSEILKGTGAAPELVVGVVLGHGDPVDIDVHGSQPVKLAFYHWSTHHLAPQHLHVFALVLGIWKKQETFAALNQAL